MFFIDLQVYLYCLTVKFVNFSSLFLLSARIFLLRLFSHPPFFPIFPCFFLLFAILPLDILASASRAPHPFGAAKKRQPLENGSNSIKWFQ